MNTQVELLKVSSNAETFMTLSQQTYTHARLSALLILSCISHASHHSFVHSLLRLHLLLVLVCQECKLSVQQLKAEKQKTKFKP